MLFLGVEDLLIKRGKEATVYVRHKRIRAWLTPFSVKMVCGNSILYIRNTIKHVFIY